MPLVTIMILAGLAVGVLSLIGLLVWDESMDSYSNRNRDR